ncbi:ATP-binding protein [Streptomyces europaeiscabiei]|uniref:ATP-binding protein n=2 Tax=Streptomyces TaxID=1883 RepID=UPI0029BA9690|nr:ATP-binding protein [Streptomyces europaeiscabiei]MDX3614173.1 ATP-binding protein [Streptomyces europaeiscabiei]MDX3635493.1 ATP-binding protein [Streptomyces europaeiscabiei]MDX3653724.1 ATP-binding protein [Streptomyces europaeiscabiei]
MTELAVNAPFGASPLDTDWEYALRIPHSPLGPGIVRAHVRAVLTRYQADRTVLDNAQLVASELVTNSLVHTRDSVVVRLLRADGRLRLSVWDSSPCLPRERPGPGLDAESGRGLWLSRACADEWGHHVVVNGRRSGGGKEVWAEWRVPGA